MILKIRIVILFIFFLSTSLYAQELPPIEVYTPKMYAGENQNWAISQDENKFIYAANNKGLLEFDGASWSLYQTPNQSIMRSVHAVGDLVYTGAYMEFGYWKRDKYGKLGYNSLSETIDGLIEDEQFWNIINVKHWVLFQSLNRIYIYNTEEQTFKTIEASSNILKMFKVKNEIYYHESNNKIFKILNGEPQLVLNSSKLQNSTVVNIVSIQNELLFITNSKGIYQLKEGVLKTSKRFSNFNFKAISIYNSIQLKDESIVLGSISDGVFHLSTNGNVLFHINQEKGLSNNTVLALFQDKESNIWLGLDNGINCIDLESPFRIHQDYKGSLGTVYSASLHKGLLYLGTNQGVFYKPQNSSENFKFIEGTEGQVWQLVVLKNTLFCGHNNGTYIIDGTKAELIDGTYGTWEIKEVEALENQLIQGGYNGIHVLEKRDSHWHVRNKIDGFNISTKQLEFLDNKTLIVNHEYKGVIKLNLNTALTRVEDVIYEESVNKGKNSSLTRYNDDVLYSNDEGVFKYNEALNVFAKDSLLSNMYTASSYTSGKLIFNKSTNVLWGFSKKSINYITQSSLDKNAVINTIDLPQTLLENKIGYENILDLNKSTYLIGTSNGYVNLNTSKIKPKITIIRLNSIYKKTLNTEKESVMPSENNEFHIKYNNIEFSCSVPEFGKYNQIEYQYKLEGHTNEWSDFTEHSSQYFENLPFGSYTFYARARVGGMLTQNTISYNFTVNRPWYLSIPMLVFYVLLLMLFSLMMHILYKRYYKKQREALLQKVERDLELKELENKQQAMRFKNESLEQEFKSKSKELAISTMSMVKKNALLKTIKDELSKVAEPQKVKSVIKTIDRNLNNTNDWQFFQKAFNNADKEFLKDIKLKHPNLTPNDLRMCAYLRLNLSSKEIAPLLNISVRSVEVKRYRLRKKMDLPHEASLTNYILEI